MHDFHWRLGMWMCNLWISCDVAASTASILNLVAISFDRYLAITHPIQYSKHGKSFTRALYFIIAVWTVSLAIALPIVFGINKLDDETVCEFTNYVYIIASSFCSFFIPCVFMSIMYTVILKRLRDRQRFKRKATGGAAGRKPQKRRGKEKNGPSSEHLGAALFSGAQLAKQMGRRLRERSLVDDLLATSTQHGSSSSDDDDDDETTSTVSPRRNNSQRQVHAPQQQQQQPQYHNHRPPPPLVPITVITPSTAATTTVVNHGYAHTTGAASAPPSKVVNRVIVDNFVVNVVDMAIGDGDMATAAVKEEKEKEEVEPEAETPVLEDDRTVSPPSRSGSLSLSIVEQLDQRCKSQKAVPIEYRKITLDETSKCLPGNKGASTARKSFGDELLELFPYIDARSRDNSAKQTSPPRHGRTNVVGVAPVVHAESLENFSTATTTPNDSVRRRHASHATTPTSDERRTGEGSDSSADVDFAIASDDDASRLKTPAQLTDSDFDVVTPRAPRHAETLLQSAEVDADSATLVADDDNVDVDNDDGVDVGVVDNNNGVVNNNTEIGGDRNVDTTSADTNTVSIVGGRVMLTSAVSNRTDVVDVNYNNTTSGVDDPAKDLTPTSMTANDYRTANQNMLTPTSNVKGNAADDVISKSTSADFISARPTPVTDAITRLSTAGGIDGKKLSADNIVKRDTLSADVIGGPSKRTTSVMGVAGHPKQTSPTRNIGGSSLNARTVRKNKENGSGRRPQKSMSNMLTPADADRGMCASPSASSEVEKRRSSGAIALRLFGSSVGRARDGLMKKVTNLRHASFKPNNRRLEKEAKKRIRRERKATVTLAVVLAVFLVCWVPFFTLHLSNAVCTAVNGASCIGYLPFLLTTWLGYMNSFMNPIIYTIFNPEYRKAFRRIVSCQRVSCR